MVQTLARPTHRQFTIGQWMVVMAVFAALFTILPAGLALIVVVALVIPLVTDFATGLRLRKSR
jgi:hypothetical protein